MSAVMDAGVHYDEEELLGLELFAAELELTLASSRDGRGDQTQLLELLQKLQASIGAAPPAVVKRCERQCETALAGLILQKGTCPVVRAMPPGAAKPKRGRGGWPNGAATPHTRTRAASARWRGHIGLAPPPARAPSQVRGLACGCISRLFAAGDGLPLFGRVNALLAELQEKDKPGGEVGGRAVFLRTARGAPRCG
jgi:hypothetical protein